MTAPAFTLERWRAGDGEAFYLASRDEALYRCMNDGFPKTPEACRALVRDFAQGGDASRCVRRVTVEGRAAGCVAAFFEGDVSCKNAEIAYWITAGLRGRGIMTQALGEFSALLFRQFGLHRLYARPFADNHASRRLLEKAGFACEGILRESVCRDGRYGDAALYALLAPGGD